MLGISSIDTSKALPFKPECRTLPVLWNDEHELWFDFTKAIWSE
tara:strand:+ start:47 stop:178 length:132 start_codon:yes stop_codon:yes gene_type:complete